ncbi:DNA polymerase delta subunit 3-like [Pararge aegeria]|uniref:DNA polymerase delta subunit 3-like n=1 Tax=Pararge aegeria TaxID=116150 RepID=UPI0019D03DBC|nr:DNA polymerase delta subunit 3-like [Pararge aegeria]
MDTEDSIQTNINTVEEMILDEEKIVTYITLSKDLCMHVNTCKQLLCNAIKKIQEEKPNVQLNISYIISGLSTNNTAITTLCTESDLDKVKKSLSPVFFHHVYSVSKGSPGVDNVALLLLHKFEDYSLCPGIIKSKECIKRTNDEIGKLKTNSQEAVGPENKPLIVVNKKIKQELKPVSQVRSNVQVIETNAVKQTEIKADTKVKVEVTSPKKDSNNKQNILKTNGPKAQKGISSFFNKPNGLQKTTNITNGLQNTKETNGLQNKKLSNVLIVIKHEDEKMNLDYENSENPITTEKEEIESKLKKEPKFKEEKKSGKKDPAPDEKNKVLNKTKKSSKVEKKRKRVLHVSDSESDEDKDPFVDNQETNNIMNDESDDEIPPTPSTNSIKITSGIVNPKKRRKVVDKTYTDEDGYILTKKEEIYESCSDNEDENIKVEKDIKIEKETRKVHCEVSPIKTKKSSPKKSKKKISPPQKGKQPTLNSFFTRK